jgi:hypothetical protein
LYPECQKQINKINATTDWDIRKSIGFSSYDAANIIVKASISTPVQHLHQACTALQNGNPV